MAEGRLRRWLRSLGSFKGLGGFLLGLLGLAVLAIAVLMFLWSNEPDLFDVRARAEARAESRGEDLVTGYVTAATLMEVAEMLLGKRGGYLRNDVAPPGVLMDNIPSWEYGVIIQMRDMARALRNDFSRSQTQSREDPDLAVADPQFSFNADSWMLPATESEYRDGIAAVGRYLSRLANPAEDDAQFYGRADNLRSWLGLVEKRLGGLSQRLSASVGQTRFNTDRGGEPDAAQAKPGPAQVVVETPWLEVDNVFYEARGASWALLHFLRAAAVDFESILRKKNALVSLYQVIRELEAAQSAVWSPVILNGSGFGVLANHSLILANYLSRANAAVIDLRALLAQG